ncbi:MAG: ABC transporter ATP-binding protein [Planctomycetota bacterium]|jgi:lipopolysaccharide transport system ATP-binding protein
MDNDIAIRVKNLNKAYKLYNHPKDRFKEAFHPFRKVYHHDFYALKNISFEIKKGETMGIIGKNGSGKSTLLQITSNVLTQSSGTVEVNGKISVLLELGASFNPEFTGIENVYFNGSIMGYSKKEIDERLDHILSFADIGEYITQPVKTYSSGTFLRLAFSVAVMIEPEILIFDEAISVGDIYFQAKCIDKMKKMIEDKGVTLLFVSHDLMTVKIICKKALFLNNGEMIDFGKSEKVIDTYFSQKIESEQKVITAELKKPSTSLENTKTNAKDNKHEEFFEDNAIFLKKASYQRTQNGEANLVNVQLLDENENIVFFVNYEQQLTLRMAIEIHEEIDTLVHEYQIRNQDGVQIIHSDSVIENKNLVNVKKGDRYIIDWHFNASLSHGDYTISSGLFILISYEPPKLEYCDRVPIATQFSMQIRPGFPMLGIAHWDNKVEIVNISKARRF